MKLWLDDAREAPKGWRHIKSATHMINLIKSFIVSEISLDNDLGIGDEDGYDVVKWLEKKAAEDNGFLMPAIHVHTANPVARQKMLAGIESIKKIKNEGV